MREELASQILEAILIAARRKINKNILKKFFDGFDVSVLVNRINQRNKESGFFIYDDGKNLEILTKPELSSYLINFFGFEENDFVQDFLEVLAIIAYGGPINIRSINKIRGEKSYYLIRELIKQGYVKKDKSSYRISNKFLNFLGFTKEEELPDYYKLREEIRKKI